MPYLLDYVRTQLLESTKMRERERELCRIKEISAISLFHHHTKVQEVDLKTVSLEINDQD